MKKTAVEWIIEEINQQQKKYIDLAKKDKSLKKGVDSILTATTLLKMKCERAKEIEKQQQGYSEEEVELIANEMVNWAIDNIGNSNPQSGKKFDEVLAKYKNK